MQWNFEPLWRGETCFIIGGGPSVRHQNLELLRGRKVLVINSSVHTVPWANALFFGDHRWYRLAANRKAVEAFGGMVVTTADGLQSKHITVVHKIKPVELTKDRHSLAMKRTSLTAAINWAVHLGAARIVLLGADGKKEVTEHKGKKVVRCHHHDPYPWPPRPGCWDAQKKELSRLVEPLKRLGIEVLNASPGSAWSDLWPVVTLESVLECDTRLSSPKTEPLIYSSLAGPSPAMATANSG